MVRLMGFAALIIFFLWFLYLERGVLTPFILAAIFAYLLNPLINLLEKRGAPRGTSTVLILLLVIGAVGYLGTMIVSRVVNEWEELTVASFIIFKNAQTQIGLLPPFLQAAILEPMKSMQTAITKPQNIWPFFSGAFSGFLNVLIFIFTSFYLLKEGRKIIDGLVSALPSKDYKEGARIVLNKINVALGAYLRGLFILIIIMATVSFIGLSVMEVKSSLFLAILIGLAEVIPVFGPLVAGTVATLFAIFDGASRFNINPLYEGAIVAGGYFVLNQVENYLIVPNLMSKVTTLHPLIVLFSVIAGGNLFGILGVILAVPVATTLRILLEYLSTKLGK